MTLCFKAASAFVCFAAVCALGQDTNAADSQYVQLGQELKKTQAELAESKKEIEELRRSLHELRQRVDGQSPQIAPPPNAAEPTVAAADQDVGFLAAKVSELHQDKVESASRYPVKLSGLILFNSYWNKGILDIQDLPSLALPNFPGAPKPGVGATLRQTILGVSVQGPKFFNAQTSADASIDFAGGSPTTAFGVTAGLPRLRTAKITLDWSGTSLSFGQEALFFSPLSPTSYATVLEPGMSWSGNLWVWTPTIEIAHRVAVNDSSSLLLQGGILDPLTEEIPTFQGRVSTAGEVSRAPAIAGRIAWDQSKSETFPFTVGFGAYRAQQQYQDFPVISSWTVNADLQAGLGKYFQISSEWYKGQAVGGLGGGIWSSVVYPEPVGPHSAIHPLRSIGEWTQLKFIPATKFEVNGAFGQDENYGSDLRVFPFAFMDEGFPAMQKNRTEFVNFIYKPNALFLLALEYRHLFTVPTRAAGHSGDQINLAAGVHF
jgi:hypothetical protein